jgi:threonine-phosphate decarboxylase
MASDLVNHGGRALAFARERNLDYRDVLDFSANINPLGPSPKAIAALRECLDVITIYPEEMPTRLARRLSDQLGVPASEILPGNGATELLYFWLRTIRARTATLIIPTFSEYWRALKSVEVEISEIRLRSDDHFRLPMIGPTGDLIILTNPNNPTGAYVPPEVMLDWLTQIPDSIQILLDEAFVEFTAQPSVARYIEKFPNLWVLRSMTKFYAIPGLRLGYLAGQGVKSIVHCREPWQVNNLAEVAGIASLNDVSYAEASLQLVQRERIWFWKQLQGLRHVRSFPTAANFFFARCDTDAMLDELIVTLADNHILIRDCRDVKGIDGPYFRFAIKRRAENARLLDYLRRI